MVGLWCCGDGGVVELWCCGDGGVVVMVVLW